MPRIRWAAHLLAAALLAAPWARPQAAAPRAADPLAGTWVIASVQRDGAADPDQVGGTLTFADGSVTLVPAAFRPSDVFD
jgi:hypothetical protein